MGLSVLCLALASASVWAQTGATGGGGIYTCVDGQGRRITSDRPIIECLDREQRELNKTGTVRRVLPPSYTAEERAQLEAQRKKEADERERIAEQKRRDRALLSRYPNQAAHDKERADALRQVDDVIQSVQKHAVALNKQRQKIDAELEFYKGDPSKAPAWLRLKLEDNQQQGLAQQRVLATQQAEKERIQARFDEELVKLRQLWGGTGTDAARPQR